MQISSIKRRSRLPWSTLAILLVLSAGVAVAEQVVVQVQTLTIRSGKGSMFPPVAQAKNQDQLEVVERQADGWLKVRSGTAEGFIKESALKPRDPSMLSGVSQGANTLSGNTCDVGASAAARGIGADTRAYAAGSKARTDALEQMIRNRDAVAGERWVRFTQEGQVGPSKPR